MKILKLLLACFLLCNFVALAQNPLVENGTATYHSNKNIGRKFKVPEVWDKIIIKENVTITGSFYMPNRNHPIEIAGESRKTSILQGDGSRPTDDGIKGRTYSAIRCDKSPNLYVHDLKVTKPMKFHIHGGFGNVTVERCDIIAGSPTHTTDGIHGGRGKTVVKDCFIDVYDDALYTIECKLVENTTIVHNKNGGPFMTSWGASVPNNHVCVIRNCTVIDNYDQTNYNHGVFSWAGKSDNPQQTIHNKIEGTFTHTINPGKKASPMYTIGRPNNGGVSNAIMKIDGICLRQNSVDLRQSTNSEVIFANCDGDGGGSPADITDLTLSSLSCTSVVLTWGDVQGEDQYRIRRKLVGDPTFTNIMDIDANSTQFIDTSISRGKSYIYQVRPMKNNTAVAISNLTEVTIQCSYSDSTFLGANYNQFINGISPTLLKRTRMKWVRGFVNLPQFLTIENGEVTGFKEQLIKNWSGIDSLIQTSETLIDGEPIKIILSIKFNFKFKNIGTPQLNTPAFFAWRDALKFLLETKNLGDKVEILVVGNEPMWETLPGEEDKLYNFTNRIIDFTNDWKNNNDWNYSIYVGALNRVNDLRTNPVRLKIMKIAKENNKVDGLDIHSHAITIEEALADPRHIREDEKFTKELISTEFSLHRLWVEHKNDELGTWGTNNGYTSNMKMYEWVNTVLQQSANNNPISDQKYMSYFNSRPWYPKNWFIEFFNAFKEYGAYVVTYGLTRDRTDPVFQLDESKPMWVLNAAYNESLFGEDNFTFYRINPKLREGFIEARDLYRPTPAPISNLVATVETCNKVELEWSDTNGEDEYRIRRRAIGETFVVLKDALADVTSFTDLSVNEDTKYEYQVRAVVNNQPVNVSNNSVVESPPCLITGTSEIINDLSIYPNPTNSLVHLSKESEWTLYSPLGEELQEGTGIDVDISDLNDGTYILEIMGTRYQIIKN